MKFEDEWKDTDSLLPGTNRWVIGAIWDFSEKRYFTCVVSFTPSEGWEHNNEEALDPNKHEVRYWIEMPDFQDICIEKGDKDAAKTG